MGHSLSDHSNSPVRNRRSSNRKSRSPSQRERSRARHKSSHRDSSPVREKHSGHAKSLKQEMSRSPSPPARYTNTQKDSSPRSKEKSSSRLRHEKSCSPSPRTKRLRRAQAEREDELVAERDRQRNHGKGDDKGSRKERETEKFSDRDHVRSGKGSDKGTHREREFEKMKGRDKDRKNGRGSENNVHRERGADRENGADRKERRSGRDIADEKSSRARDERSASPSDSHHRSRHRSRSPRRDVDRREHDEVTNTRGIENGEEGDDSLARMKAAEEALEAKQKNQPSFELSGKLAAETNRFRGVTLLFNEPPEACKPDIRWRLYIFKAGEMLNEPLYIHRQSCYLFGRERRVADIPTDHPSCSKQHAVVQFRKVEKEQPDGTLSKQVRPYIMDLGSTNKTFINDNPIEPQRYYELFEKDTIKFGNSSREYVLLHENSAS